MRDLIPKLLVRHESHLEEHQDRLAKLMEERELHTLWRRTLARARVRLRPPETLRHSCISSLLSRGAPLLAVAGQTGHSAHVMLGSYARWQEQAPV